MCVEKHKNTCIRPLTLRSVSRAWDGVDGDSEMTELVRCFQYSSDLDRGNWSRAQSLLSFEAREESLEM